MFFFFSKTLNYITMPMVIICILLLLSALIRSQRWKSRLFRIGLALLLVLSNDFVINELMLAWEVPPTPLSQIDKHYAWGIVLSGVVRSDMEPKDRVYFQRGADRVIHAFQLYKTGVISKILVSGGSGKLFGTPEREADEIATVLIMMGARPEDILTENRSRNTHESAVEVKALLTGKAKPRECILITSAFHMKRSAACFVRTGWRTDLFSTDFLSHRRKYSIDSLLIPHVEALVNAQVLLKEWLGYLAYSLAGYL